MVNKALIWISNAFLASVLIMLASANPAWAQETPGDSPDVVVESDTVAPTAGKITVPLSGTGTMVSNGLLSVAPSQVQFGLLDVGMSETLAFTIAHTGGVDAQAVQIQDAVLFGKSTSEFTSSFNGFTTLNGGESLDATVTFSPQTPGTKAAGLRLTIAGATTPYVVLFTATARYPLTSELGISDTKLDFGEIIQNGNSQKNFILTNKGEDGAPAIAVSAIELSGINAGKFVVNFTPTTLLPGEALDVKVDMDTATLGFKSAKAEVFHDGVNPSLEVDFDGNVVTPENVPINFGSSILKTNQQIERGTSLQFGPDGKLYVAEMDGLIFVFDVKRNGKNNYTGTLVDTISLIKNVPNHNDDGTPNFADKRLLTGIHVAGSAATPVIYAVSSDPRQAAGPSGNDSNLDTNSGILHKLTKADGTWAKLDLVRGLPRSEENHVSNGLVLVNNKIYVNVGGNTNMGVPSNNFAELPEYALSAATLVIDLATIGNNTYDLPTLDGPADQYDPFGGHDGLNQAILEANGPVKIFASGLRNAYDIVYSESGQFYVWDNGPNTGWGGPPGASCKNTIDNGGIKHGDGLHLIKQGYYAGHPNPTRGNKANTFGGQSPIEGAANPEECEYKDPVDNDSLVTNNPSTNGLDEYTASNFAGSMKGDLIAAAFDKSIYRVQLNKSGTAVLSKSVLKANQGTVPLDVTTQSDDDVFPGTIWIVDNIVKTITVMEPSDY